MSRHMRYVGTRIPVSRELLDEPLLDWSAVDAWLREAALWIAAGVRQPDPRIDVEAMRFVTRERRPLRRAS